MLFRSRALGVLALVPPAPCQLRHQHVGNVLEIAGRDRERDVEAVDIRRLEPCFDLVCDHLGRADHDRAGAAKALGCEAIKVSDVSELKATLTSAFNRPGTKLIEVMVDGKV